MGLEEHAGLQLGGNSGSCLVPCIPHTPEGHNGIKRISSFSERQQAASLAVLTHRKPKVTCSAFSQEMAFEPSGLVGKRGRHVE